MSTLWRHRDGDRVNELAQLCRLCESVLQVDFLSLLPFQVLASPDGAGYLDAYDPVQEERNVLAHQPSISFAAAGQMRHDCGV